MGGKKQGWVENAPKPKIEKALQEISCVQAGQKTTQMDSSKNFLENGTCQKKKGSNMK